MTVARPLTSRKLDLIYTIFFICHIPATLLLDLQVLYPKQYVPAFLPQLTQLYLATYNDPIVGGVNGQWPPYEADAWTWLKCFFTMELVFQLPMFLIGIQQLRRDNPKVYPWLLIYGAHVTTTVIPCLAIIFSSPVGDKTISGKQLSFSQRDSLLASYGIFLAIPLIMMIDMAFRLSHAVSASNEGRSNKKSE